MNAQHFKMNLFSDLKNYGRREYRFRKEACIIFTTLSHINYGKKSKILHLRIKNK